MKIDYSWCFDAYDEGWYYTKGHVDKREFLKETEAEYGIEFDTEEDIEYSVKHIYARRLPPRPEHDFVMRFDVKPKQGAFKITSIYVG